MVSSQNLVRELVGSPAHNKSRNPALAAANVREGVLGVRVQVATVRSAVKLEQEQQFLIAKKLQELTGSKNVKVKPILDESLIAGFVVEYGSAQIDLSIDGQLKKITAELYAKYSEKGALV
jgi:F0F1-type ATP synthase delta subunit